jgi:hypothetical protein
MATTIKIKNSSISGSSPSSLQQGEFAINVTDGRLFYGSGSGNEVKEFTGTNINTGSFVTTSSFNTFTSSLNTFTSSIQTEVNVLTSQTGSYATTGSNTFIGNQYIVGNITASIISASFVGTFQQITGITVTSQSWGLTGSIYSSSISNVNITANTVVDVIPNNANYTIVLAAQLLPQNISSAGEVTVFAVNEPTDDINVTLNLFK